MSAYESIKLYGLVGDDYLDTIDVTNSDEALTTAITETFTNLADAFRGTLVGALDVEPILWGFVNLLHRHRIRIERSRDQYGDVIKRLIAEFDGGEITDTELQKARDGYERADEREAALTVMLDTAMAAYEDEFSKPWFPRSGSTASKTTTAAMIDARDFLAASKQREVEAKAPEGSRVIIAGGHDYQDHKAIWSALDRTRDRLGDMVLMHGGGAKGVDKIAALWAKSRNVAQVAFKPDFQTYRKAAPFKRNDEMLAAKPKAVILFPGNGISENVGQKAELNKIPVWKPVKEAA